MTDIDQNEIMAKVAVDSLERAISLFAQSLDDARRKVSVRFGAGFSKFKRASVARYGSVRTLMHRDKPIPLRDLYVETSIEHDDQIISDEELISTLSSPSKSLIVGTAGGGKSMLMRFINLVLSESDNGVLPIFFELRTLNSRPEANIVSALVEHVSVHINDVDISIFESLIEENRVILILDGFDEIDYDQRERFASEISELSRRFPKMTVIVSSRPDDLIGSIETFSIYKVLPFSKEQTVSLLSKLPYDEVVKDKFIADVDKQLYERHKDFLSNPLLITMMLMTYHQFAEIPKKVHIFYQQAFETLFSWHDSSKDVFKRKSYTDLPIDEFQRAFSYFCTSSYLAQAFSFSSARVRQLLSAAITAERVEASPDLLLKDLLESTCLLQREGLEVVFVHRSFQEYFTALFITRLDSKDRKKAIDAIAKRAHLDLVISMAHEMAPAAIEKSWAIPTAKALLKKIETNGKGDPLRTLFTVFEFISFSKSRTALHWDVSKIWGARAVALDKISDLSLPAIGKEKNEAAYEKFVQRMHNDPEYQKKISNGYYDGKLDTNPIPPQILIPADETFREIFTDLDMERWSEAIIQWLKTTRDEMSARASTREISIDSMLSR